LSLAHNAVCQLNKEFIGKPHIAALVNLIGTKHLAVLLGEISNGIDAMVPIHIPFTLTRS
jgi:hypothetical protein